MYLPYLSSLKALFYQIKALAWRFRGVISRVTVVIIHLRGLIIPLITTDETPSVSCPTGMFGLFSDPRVQWIQVRGPVKVSGDRLP